MGETTETSESASFWSDLAKTASDAQVQYGRWIVNTLWLMHSGAIAGLATKWNVHEPLPFKGSFVCFGLGILLAFAAAIFSWFNFTFATNFYRARTSQTYPSGEKESARDHLLATAFGASICILCSVICLATGALLAMGQILQPQVVNTIGIVISLMGVVILFRYGMPFRVATGGDTFLITGEISPSERVLDTRYKILGYVGLALSFLVPWHRSSPFGFSSQTTHRSCSSIRAAITVLYGAAASRIRSSNAHWSG